MLIIAACKQNIGGRCPIFVQRLDGPLISQFEESPSKTAIPSAVYGIRLLFEPQFPIMARPLFWDH
jgi:hypothetical protein